MSTSTFRWGILGPGKIAHKFASGLKVVPDAALTAIGSRSLQRSQEFAAQYGASSAYGTYEELVDDPNVDAIYIATPHTMHHEHTLLALRHGKPVLVEKPFAVNAIEAAEMISVARQQKLFLLEAMWTRFFPLFQEINDIIASGVIGEPRMLLASFGFRADFDPSSRLFAPQLAGGSLLDVGIYPLSLSSYLFGKPVEVTGVAEVGLTGVDEQAAFVLKHKTGAISSLVSAVRTNTPHDARIIGSEGAITIADPFWIPTKLTITSSHATEEVRERPLIGNGYEFEAIEAARAIRNGETQSPLLPLSETYEIVTTMDKLRQQWGVRYSSD